MFKTLDVFRMAQSMAAHAGHRQALVAENVAHADTPGYRARDLQPFGQTYSNPGQSPGLQATRPGHLFGQDGATSAAVVETRTNIGKNGNAVTIEEQMLKAVEVKRQHDRAIAIYKSSLTVLRASIGRSG